MTALLYAAGVVIFVLALYVSIALHELGHLTLAKRYGCRVSEYMIGFGPTLFRRTRGETTYGVKLIPLGGFVTIIGMFPPKAADAADGEAGTTADGEKTVRLRKSNTGLFAQVVSETRSEGNRMITTADNDRLFYKLPWHRKVAVMAAGPVVNLLIAFVCFQAVFGLYGTHEVRPTGDARIASVAECVLPVGVEDRPCESGDEASPAAKMGLGVGDEVLAFNGEEVAGWDELSEHIHANGGQTVTLTVERSGNKVKLPPMRLASTHQDVDDSGNSVEVGFLGASPTAREVVTRHGPLYTLEQMATTAWDSVVSIVTMPVRVAEVAGNIVGVGERDPDGPVSIIGGSRVAGEVASASEPETGLGVPEKAAMLGILTGGFNLFLGLFNLIPLLPLDGGHIAGSVWEGLRRGLARLFRREDSGYVDVAVQMPVALMFGAALLAMGVVLMIGDIVVPLSTGL